MRLNRSVLHCSILISVLALVGQDARSEVIFSEDFESVELDESVDENLFEEGVWAEEPPAGWALDSSGVAGADEELGVTEWRGWSFADGEWWAETAGDQRRSEFSKASGAVAIADPDEWDDLGNPSSVGTFNSFLTTPEIDISQQEANSLTLTFDSSWRPSLDQKASVSVAYDGGAERVLLEWVETSDDKTNESIILALNNPAGASVMEITFGLEDAVNDWWWAIDNIAVATDVPLPPVCPSELTATVDREAKSVTLNWSAAANVPDGMIEVLRGSESLAELPLESVTFTDTPPGTDGEGRIEFAYTIRVKGDGAGDCGELSRKVLWSLGETEGVFSENFDDLELGEPVDEELFEEAVWTGDPPAGWEIDNSEMAGIDLELGVTEWRGWGFADHDWWAATAGDQRRSEFERANGAAAIADPDEWDDLGSPTGEGTFNSFLTTPEIDISGETAGGLPLAFDSSFRPYATQTATVAVSYDGGVAKTVFERIESTDDKTNERIVVALANPEGAKKMTITFGLAEAGNDWWWAIDNILVTGDPVPILPSGLEAVADQETKTVTLSWIAGANLGDAMIEVLRDGQVVATKPVTDTTHIDSPPVDGGGLLVFNYGVRVTGEADSLLKERIVYSIPPPKKIAQWDFNELDGMTVSNAIGGEWEGEWFVDREFPAEPGEEPTWLDAGDFGGAVSIEGVGHFELGDFDATEGLRPVDGITVASWVKVTDFINWAGIFNHAFDSGASEAGYYMGTRDGGDFHFAVATEDTGTLNYLRAPGVLDEWTHVVGTFDGETIRLYLDGEEANNVDHPGLILYESTAGDVPLGAHIGTFLDDNEYFPFGGSIAHISIWNGPLDAAAVKALHEEGLAGKFGGGATGVRVTRVEHEAERGEVSLTWTSRPGSTYAIESSGDLQTWTELDDGVDSAGETTSFTDTPAADAPFLYYRVVER